MDQVTHFVKLIEIGFANDARFAYSDNANNLENLKLWTPLIGQLAAPEPAMRYMAAWVCGTAVQNNLKSQENVCFSNPLPVFSLLLLLFKSQVS